MDTILRNVRIRKGGSWTPVDLGIEDGRFVAIGSIPEPTAREIDAAGKYVLPGMVDLHVHFNDPGREGWEGFPNGTAAAAAAGVTSVADMPLNSFPAATSRDTFARKRRALAGRARIDYGLWGGVIPGNAREIPALAAAGAMGFKAFFSPSGIDDFPHSPAATIREAMLAIAATGLRLAVHAEDPEVLDRAAASLATRESAVDWLASRPVEAECRAVRTLLELAAETGCPLTIVHITSVEVEALITEARRAGLDVVCETCPHYLLLNADAASTLGTVAKCAPPLRSEPERRDLWDAVARGSVATIGSDHSPSDPSLKEGCSFFEAWGGISGIQHGAPLLLDRVLREGPSAPLEPWIASLATRPAELAGFSGKGSLAEGGDADFFLVEERETAEVIEVSELLTRHPLSPYCGHTTRHRVVETWLRGEPVWSQGSLVGALRGRFLPGKAQQP